MRLGHSRSIFYKGTVWKHDTVQFGMHSNPSACYLLNCRSSGLLKFPGITHRQRAIFNPFKSIFENVVLWQINLYIATECLFRKRGNNVRWIKCLFGTLLSLFSYLYFIFILKFLLSSLCPWSHRRRCEKLIDTQILMTMWYNVIYWDICRYICSSLFIFLFVT